MKPPLNNLLRFVYIAVIAGFIVGTVVSYLDISGQGYISYGVYNLALLILWQNITKYTLLLILSSLVLFIVYWSLSSLYRSGISENPSASKIINKRAIGSLVISLLVAIVLGLILQHYSTDLISYIRGSALKNILGGISASKKHTVSIYQYATYVATILFFVAFTYVLFRSRLTEKITDSLYKAP